MPLSGHQLGRQSGHLCQAAHCLCSAEDAFFAVLASSGKSCQTSCSDETGHIITFYALLANYVAVADYTNYLTLT